MLCLQEKIMTSNNILTQATQACLEHARALLESARVVQEKGHPNIAYHLAVLALEELGRRELICVQNIAIDHFDESPASLKKHTANHVQKLFWCFFGGLFFEKKLTKSALDSLKGFAKNLHNKRLKGLYVEQNEDELKIPSDAIQTGECEEILKLAEKYLTIAEAKGIRENITDEEHSLQAWFLQASTDLEKRSFFFSNDSLSKLDELRNVQLWIHWLRREFNKIDAENTRFAQMEIERSRKLEGAGNKNKWKLRIRLYSGSHTVRAKELSQWNKSIDSIKLIAVPEKKNELIVEFLFLDNVPIHALWYFGWGVARHFVVALNIGTMGFWWWRQPEQVDKYYEDIEDVEFKKSVLLKRSPSLKIDWGENRILKAEDLNRISLCFAALPEPHEQQKHAPFNYYIGGLTFLSLNDVHWQCESTIFGNFFECLRAMMAEVGDWKEEESFTPICADYLRKIFVLNDEDLNKFIKIIHAYESKSTKDILVNLQDTSFAKLFCDSYFLDRFRPISMKKKGLTRLDLDNGKSLSQKG